MDAEDGRLRGTATVRSRPGWKHQRNAHPALLRATRATQTPGANRKSTNPRTACNPVGNINQERRRVTNHSSNSRCCCMQMRSPQPLSPEHRSPDMTAPCLAHGTPFPQSGHAHMTLACSSSTCNALANSSRATSNCCSRFRSLTATTPRARSSSPANTTKRIPARDAY